MTLFDYKIRNDNTSKSLNDSLALHTSFNIWNNYFFNSIQNNGFIKATADSLNRKLSKLSSFFCAIRSFNEFRQFVRVKIIYFTN